MDRKAPITLGHGIQLIDGFDLKTPGRTGTYVIEAESLTLVETGPSPSVPYILAGLEDLGHEPADVAYIIVTHVHLDHAGGAGLLLQSCPHAQVIVHPRGERHLADPTKLVQGARQVYGDIFDDLFDPVVAVPQERLITKKDGDTLQIADNRTLTFYDSPGHAKHHFSIYDPVSNGLFTGDTTGVRYHQTEDVGFTFYLPTTSPNHFDPAAMQQSMKRFADFDLSCIYFGHFSQSYEPLEVMRQVSDWLPVFVQAGEEALAADEGTQGIKTRLSDKVTQYLRERDVPDDHAVYNLLDVDFDVCALGIADYLQKRAASS